MEILIGFLIGVFGFFIYEFQGRKKNDEVDEKVKNLDKDFIKNKTLLEVEEEKREEIKRKKSNANIKEIVDYFNNDNKNK